MIREATTSTDLREFLAYAQESIAHALAEDRPLLDDEAVEILDRYHAVMGRLAARYAEGLPKERHLAARLLDTLWRGLEADAGKDDDAS
jgi:hypothetical protein